MAMDIHERAFQFSCEVIRIHRALAKKPDTDRVLASQLFRSATSIGANLEEAKAGQSKADFVAKCRIALKEARESHYWIRLLAATTQRPAIDRLPEVVAEAGELVAILTTIVKKASSSSARGPSA